MSHTATGSYKKTGEERLLFPCDLYACDADDEASCCTGTSKRSVHSVSSLGLLDDSGKGGLFVNGEIGKHLAVDLDTGLLEASDEAAVGQAVVAGSSVDTRNPQRTELTLTDATVTVGVLAGLITACLATRKTRERAP